MQRYLVSMGIRTGCFILAVVALAVLQWMVVGWLLVSAAVVLPYIAVVVANAKRSPGSTTLGPVTPSVAARDVITGPEVTPRRRNEEPPA